ADLRAAVLLVQPVQALGPAQRPQGVLRWRAVAARGLARAVGHVRAHLARRDRPRSPRRLAFTSPPTKRPRALGRGRGRGPRAVACRVPAAARSADAE